MATIANLMVKIGAQNRDLEKGLKQSTQQVSKFVKSTAQKVNKLKKIFSILGGIILARFVYSLNQAAKQIDFMAKKAKLLNTGVKELQVLSYEAQLAGISFETLTMGMQRMIRRVSEASKGMGEAQGALRELGLDAENLTRLRADEQLNRIGQALMGITDQNEQVRLAFKIFDSEGVTILRKFRDQTKDAKKELEALGVLLGKDQVKQVESYNDSMTKFSTTWQGFKNNLAAVLAGPAKQILEWMTDSIKKAGGMKNIVKGLVNSVIDGVGSMGDAFTEFAKFINTAINSLENADKVAKRLATSKPVSKAKAFGIGSAEGWKQVWENAKTMVGNIPQTLADKPTNALKNITKGTSSPIQKAEEAYRIVMDQEKIKRKQLTDALILNKQKLDQENAALDASNAARRKKLETLKSKVGMKLQDTSQDFSSNMKIQKSTMGGVTSFSGVPTYEPTNKQPINVTLQVDKEMLAGIMLETEVAGNKIKSVAEKEVRNVARQVAR